MANLITKQQKITLSREYLTRLVATSLLLLSLLGAFLLAYVIPYYFYVLKNDQIATTQLQAVIKAENKEKTSPDEMNILIQTIDQMKTLEIFTANKISPSLSFSQIITNGNSGIKISHLSFSLIKDGQAQIVVNGLAKDRDGLVTFINGLKTKTDFASIESPISDFAKSSDIPFTIKIQTKI